MKKILALAIQLHFTFVIVAQQNHKIPELWRGGYVITNVSGDTLSEIDRIKIQKKRSENAMRHLKESGALVIRLKTNQKSVDAYRNSGQIEIAEKIVEDRISLNKRIYWAFKNSFTFCPVYFIYAKDTRDFLNGAGGLLLNEELNYDSSIVLTDTFFVIAEQGTALGDPNSISHPTNGYVPFQERRKLFLDTFAVQRSTSNASENAIVFFDKNLEQYFSPFPFCEGIYLNMYNSSAKILNSEFYKSYRRLVEMPDNRAIRKAEKKKLKEQLKKLK